MKTVAIVCEYNPFHLGHEHQLREIKRAFGADTAIIAIMSGNYVQRASVAVLDKYERARIAVECGVSLVLELPFPYSSASAEYFASAAVGIADALGCVDILSFGSECGNLEALTLLAERTDSSEFQSAVLQALKKRDNSSLGYAKIREDVYSSLYGNADASLLSSPNNILAVEYIKALRRLGSAITPHTLLRVGTDDDKASKAQYAGATFIRSLLLKGETDAALAHMPPAAHTAWHKATKSGAAPATVERISSAILSAFRMNTASEDAAECSGGLYEHLKKAARSASTFQELISVAATKKFTDARLRRAALFSYFGVTPATLRERAAYTQVLAMDGLGQAVLHNIRKSSGIAILTKAADVQKISQDAQRQAEAAHRADSVYALCSPVPRSADIFLRTSPYRK